MWRVVACVCACACTHDGRHGSFAPQVDFVICAIFWRLALADVLFLVAAAGFCSFACCRCCLFSDMVVLLCFALFSFFMIFFFFCWKLPIIAQHCT